MMNFSECLIFISENLVLFVGMVCFHSAHISCEEGKTSSFYKHRCRGLTDLAGLFHFWNNKLFQIRPCSNKKCA
jgi:hypothetical protein